MEGEGPGSGVPIPWSAYRFENGFTVDLAALDLINVDYRQVPVMKRLRKENSLRPVRWCLRARISHPSAVKILMPALAYPEKGDWKKDTVPSLKGYSGQSLRSSKKAVLPVEVHRGLPSQTIHKDEDNRALSITASIRCFCCHEFCPKNQSG